jgi:hypothetical protein
MLDIIIYKRESAMRLLFWRAFSDLGVAIRFILTFYFNHQVCHHSICSVKGEYITMKLFVMVNGAYSDTARDCGFPSAWLEFFEIASEMWFIIVAIDLWKSLVNPFSSTNSWMWKYHLAVWSISFAFALPTGLDSEIYGFWYVDDKVDKTAICWITQQKHSTKPYVYILFYIPLVLVYIVAIISVVVAYRRLRHGISSTIIHRMKALVINGINVLVYLAYWGVLLFLLALAFLLEPHTSEKWSERVLLFLISAKGVSAVVVWILTVEVQFEPSRSDGTELKDEGGVDLNGALRQELLYFATSGIRTCVSKSSTLKRDQKQLVLFLQHREEKSGVELSPSFFLYLVFGREHEKRKIIALASAAHEVTRLSPMEMEIRDNSIVSNTDDRRSQSAVDIRMSQRPTEVVGKGGFMTASEAVEMGILGTQQTSATAHTSTNSYGRPTEIVVTKVDDNVQKRYGKHVVAEVMLHGFVTQCVSGWAAFMDYIDRTFGDGRRDVAFIEEEPYHFQRVRKSQRVSDEDYIEQFRTTIKERVTQGGASGAFFFFSRDEKFIAKSCTAEEFAVLCVNAKRYADYLDSEKGKNSYISKVFGAYTMQIYGISLHFFVMNNLFHDKDATGENLSIHEKYDIKGSTVNRSSVPPVEGQTATCTHCEQKFTYHKKAKKAVVAGISGKSIRGGDDLLDPEAQRNRCSATVNGQHEPNVIMKDNDLKYKIRLPRPVAKRLMTQLENDAHFLHDVGVMDYSLLVGVHNTQYEVRGDHVAPSQGSGSPSKPTTSDSSTAESTNPLLTSSINNSKHFTNHGDGNFLDNFDENVESKRLEVSRVVGPDTYIMGIIDFQQQWNFSKKVCYA